MDIRVELLVDGADLGQKVSVQDIRCELGVNAIPNLSVCLRDGDFAQEKFEVTDKGELAPGKPLECKVGFGDKPKQSIFKGIITKQEIGFDRQGYLCIEAQGDVIKLAQSRFSKFYDEKIKEDALIKDLFTVSGAEAPEVASTSEIEHSQYLVYEQTPWRIMMHRILTNGFVLAASDKTKIVDLADPKGAKHEINLATAGCIDFHLGLDASAHIKKLEYAGWDVKEQKLFDNAAGAPPALKKFAKADEVLIIPDQLHLMAAPVSEAEVKAKAKAEATYRLLDMYQGAVNIKMAPENKLETVALLDNLTLSGIGTEYAGDYLVTGIRHHITPQGWQLEFSLGLSLNHTLWSDWNTLEPLPMMIGKIPAYKKDNKDPDGFERLPVDLPTATGGKPIWAKWLTPYAAAAGGLYLPPEPETEVIVDFIGGDGRFPVIMGTNYTPKMIQPFKFDDNNLERGLIFPENKLFLQFTLDKDKEKPKFTLQSGDGNTLTLGPEKGMEVALKEKSSLKLGEKTEIASKEGKATVTISDAFAVKADGNATIEAAATEIK